MIKIIQIVPRLKPAIDGVGDYSLVLANKLLEKHDIETLFLVCDPLWRGEDVIDGFQVIRLTDRTEKRFFATLSKVVLEHQISKVLLQYVGYGYEKRGCPVWLIRGLSKFKIKSSKTKIITMFHELYGSSWRPWTSSFWNSGQQKCLVKCLLNLSDSALTNNQLYFSVLKKINLNINVLNLPNFSNMGEHAFFLPWTERECSGVLFGNGRKKFIQDHNFITVIKRIRILRVYDVGTNPENVNLDRFQMNFIRMGKLESLVVHETLSKCTFGFVDCPSRLLGKSGVFAAYCAHGVLPIVRKLDHETDGLKEGTHFLSYEKMISNDMDKNSFEKIARNAFDWYAAHSQSKVAEKYATLLN